MKQYHSTFLSDKEKTILENAYYRYRDMMYAAAFSLLHHEADAEDVVHEVFLKLARKYMSTIERLAAEGTLPYYLLTATKNAALSHLKRERAGKETPVDLAELPESFLKDNSQSAYFDASREESEIMQMMNELDPEYQALLYQRYVMELSVKEMADFRHQSLSAVKYKLRQAKSLLWKKFKENDNE